jgi:branched-chain amino acid transport system permease protein
MTAALLRLRGTDWTPYAVLPVLLVVTLPAMSLATWLTLTVAGIAMGMMLFLMAAGLTLIFGLMQVFTFAHGAFITLGAYVAVSVVEAMTGWSTAPSWWPNLAVLATALIVALAVCGVVGFVFERVIIRRVYGAHLRQILITVGGLIIAEQLVVALWGANPIPLPKPPSFRGSIILGDAAIEKYRLLAVALGLAVYGGLHFLLNRTRVGLLVRAGVENLEMVEALGYRIRRLFVGVFVTGTALAGVGGVMWALYQESVARSIGGDMTILIFIILIIGGLGSIGGCFTAAVLVGLVTNYVGFLAPKLALGSTILLMMLILLWRPRGLFPVAAAG